MFYPLLAGFSCTVGLYDQNPSAVSLMDQPSHGIDGYLSIVIIGGLELGYTRVSQDAQHEAVNRSEELYIQSVGLLS